MDRKDFIKNTTLGALAVSPLVKKWNKQAIAKEINEYSVGPAMPVFIYNNWSSYDELSDNIPLTEKLSLYELEQVTRLKSNGVKIDYYLMDAFWFDVGGGYRTWDKNHWPNGPDRWLKGCRENDIKPGMWFSTNLVVMSGKRELAIIPEWKDSVATDTNILCLFDGGYLNHLYETLQLWYDKGVRVFKFDFAYFEAVTPRFKDKYSPEEIKEKNKTAFMQMLKKFRTKNADVLILGYNGFGGVLENTYMPFTKTIDMRWLGVFDTLYSGDPRFSDVPMMNIWRSEDLYHDHQNRQFAFNGLPMRRIDSCSFMNGTTGTCYSREMQSWKGELLLELARGGWVNTYHGNLELFSDDDAHWFARAQALFRPLMLLDNIKSFGSIPGKGLPYGYIAKGENGTVCTAVNPSQQTSDIILPVSAYTKKMLLYADGGFIPVVKKNTITLGAEQLAVVGFDEYADKEYYLGTDESICIPENVAEIKDYAITDHKKSIQIDIKKSINDNLRVIVQQFDKDGNPYRTWAGAPPDGKNMEEVFKITVKQNGNEIATVKQYNKIIWSGLSWAVAEVTKESLQQNGPVSIYCSTAEEKDVSLRVKLYAVNY